MLYDKNTTCADMLKAWDSGDPVWSVEMGGLGPGYEQAIQILMMELVRELVRIDWKWRSKPSAKGEVVADLETRFTAALDPIVVRVSGWPGCGFSGAQVGAAMLLAGEMHRLGPLATVDRYPDERRIMISHAWPHGEWGEGT